MASAALLFSFSAILFVLLLLQAPAPAPPPGVAVADLLVAALDRLLDGRGLLELATRRNMILLCHAILFLVLRDAGVLGKPASRRPPVEATAAAAVAVAVTEIDCSAAPALPHATRGAVVVWRRRRPRNRAVVAPVHEHDAGGRVVVECRPAVEVAATWATPVLTTGPPALAAEEATKQIVLAEPPRNDDEDLIDRHDRAAVVEPLERPSTAIEADGERDDCDRCVVAVANDDTAREQQTAGMELADDRTFEEFIKSQRRQMRREESLQLISSGSGYHHYQYSNMLLVA